MYLKICLEICILSLPHSTRRCPQDMAAKPPRSYVSSKRSTFSLIDPNTSQFHRQIDRHGALTSGLRTHVAISYVWSEWREKAEDKLPSWIALQARLRPLFESSASHKNRTATGRTSRCWIDCMCIDQESSEDKAYWIPRMDEIYYEAQCTILLLRTPGLDLDPLLEIQKGMHCPLAGPPKLRDIIAPHNCLLCQSCTLLPLLDPELEVAAINAMRVFCHSNWRQRAWILQEILLSQNYIITWNDTGNWLSIADTGVIAGLLFRRNIQERWLDDFATWCRRLWYLRQNYETQTYELCDANVLQLASGLNATVPSDKYYALCGMLRLKHVQPNPTHSADQALGVIVDVLVSKGRMSWLYAVPAAIQGFMTVRDGMMAPFVMTRLEEHLKPNRKHKAAITSNAMSIRSVLAGAISQVLPLSTVLDTAFTHLRETRSFGFPPPISYCHRIPDIIRRLSLEIVDPILSEPTFGLICKALGPVSAVKSQARKAWLCVLFLSFIDESLITEMCNESSADHVQIVRSTAASLQQHLKAMKDKFSVTIWKTGSDAKAHIHISVALAGCPVDASIFSINGDQDLMFAARSANNYAEYCGPIFQLNVRDTVGPRPSSLFTGAFWRKRDQSSKVQTLQFNYNTASIEPV